MSYSENGSGTQTVMPVQPYGGAGYGGDFFGGNSAWWLIILLLFANNGWGNGFGGFGGGMMPFMLGNQQGSEVQREFDQSAQRVEIDAVGGQHAKAAMDAAKGGSAKCPPLRNISRKPTKSRRQPAARSSTCAISFS